MAAAEPETASEELLDWAQGPVRWLLLPSDWRELKKIEEPNEALNFVNRFWRLRDPDPSSEENEFHAAFLRRVEAADLLYTEGDARGSLTPRGRALILLGPPPRMQLATEDTLAWKPGRRSGARSTTREIRVEIWRYGPEDLPDKLIRVLRAAELETAVEIKFHLGRREVKLAAGENTLITVARLALVQE